MDPGRFASMRMCFEGLEFVVTGERWLRCHGSLDRHDIRHPMRYS